MAMMNNGVFRIDDTRYKETWNLCAVSIRREAVYFVLSILAVDLYIISNVILLVHPNEVEILLPIDKCVLAIILTAWLLVGIAFLLGISTKKKFHFSISFVLLIYAMVMSAAYVYQQEVKPSKSQTAAFISACIIILLLFFVVLYCIHKKNVAVLLNYLRKKWSHFARSFNSNANPPDPNEVPLNTLNGRSSNLEPDDSSPRYIRLPLPGSEARTRMGLVLSNAVAPLDEESADYGVNLETRLERLGYLANSVF